MTIPLTLFPPNRHNLTDDQFYELCVANRDLRIERSSNGEIIIMPPTGGETGRRNNSISGQLWYWNHRVKLGVVFDSSTGFRLPNGATRSPDAAWIPQEQWNGLTQKERGKFLFLCPAFVVELRSPSDRLEALQAKLTEYIENGTKLGWLIDPVLSRVEVYSLDREIKILSHPTILSGEPVLMGFELDLTDIL